MGHLVRPEENIEGITWSADRGGRKSDWKKKKREKIDKGIRYECGEDETSRSREIKRGMEKNSQN